MPLEVIAWASEEPPSEDALRQRLEKEGFSVFCWTDAPDATYAPHRHEEDESLWVLDGSIVFGVDGRDLPLRRGDRLMLPRGTVHTAKAGAEGARYLIGERR